jgi:hypothetical protein
MAARSLARWLCSAPARAALIAARRSELICRMTATKMPALESKWA